MIRRDDELDLNFSLLAQSLEVDLKNMDVTHLALQASW